MRILFVTDSLFINGAYNLQVKELATRLMADDHYCAVLATIYRGKPAHVDGIDQFGNYSLYNYAEDIWDEVARSVEADIIFTFKDPYAFNSHLLEALATPWVALAPVDTDPASNVLVASLQASSAVVTLTQDGQRKLETAGISAFYAPFGYNRAEYFPGDKQEARERLGIPLNAFVPLFVGQNNSNPSRKNIDQVIRAVAAFNQVVDDCVFFLHTDVQHPMGIPVGMYLPMFGFGPDNLRVTDQSQYRSEVLGSGFMRTMYQAADVLLIPSTGEGFCVPAIEAQACFSYNTEVVANDCVCGMSRLYSGKMVEIDTPQGVIHATADHPFWTEKGWLQAGQLDHNDRLLYSPGHASKRIQQLHTGRIGDIANTLCENVVKGSRGAHGKELRVGSLAATQAGLNKAPWPENQVAPHRHKSERLSLRGWSGRRRRFGFNSQDAAKQVEAICVDSEYITKPFGMVEAEVGSSVDLYRAPGGQGKQSALIYLPNRRRLASAILSSPGTAFGYQAKADGVSNRILRGENGNGRDGSPGDLAPPGRDHFRDQSVEYQTVTSVRHYEVTDLPVYNLTTLSGLYTAGGFLVHNCGTPVIATHFAGLAETSGTGWHIPVSDDGSTGMWELVDFGAMRFKANVPAIVEQLKIARVKRDHPDIKADAIKFARHFEWDNIYAAYWQQFFDSLPGQLESAEL